MSPLVAMVLVAAALEALYALIGYALGGMPGFIAALIGASIATAAQIVAVSLLRPAMGGTTPQFQQRWVLGTAVRFASFIVLAVLLVTLKTQLPPLWMAVGYLGTMLVLLFAETRFLK